MTVERTLADPVALRMEPTSGDDDDVRVQLFNDNTEEVYYSVVRGAGFYQSRQKRGELVNKSVENLPDVMAAEDVRQKLGQVMSWLDAHHDEVRKQTRPDGVQKVIASTKRVTAQRGEETEFTVTVQHDGREADLTFTTGEWANNSPHPLIEQWTGAFLRRPEGITADRWEEIRSEWEDRLGNVTEAGPTKAELVADQVVQGIRKTALPAVAEKKHLRTDKHAALYDDDKSVARNGFAADGPVLWVRSGLVLKKLTEVGESTDYASQLSVTLQQSGVLKGPSERHRLGDAGQKYSLYPFDADELGVDPGMDVVERDGGPDSEVEP